LVLFPQGEIYIIQISWHSSEAIRVTGTFGSNIRRPNDFQTKNLIATRSQGSSLDVLTLVFPSDIHGSEFSETG
jgi:hypothetical protein